MSKQDDAGKKNAGDEKKKKQFDNFGWWLAWIGFAGGLLIAFYNLARKSESPKKNDYFK